MRYYPIFLDLRGQRCLVVGGGKVAERKVRALLRAGAAVHVISPDLTPRLALLAAKTKLGFTPRAYKKGDLGSLAARRGGPSADAPLRPLLVFAATDDSETQQSVEEEARAIGAPVNAADDRHHSTFLVPASFAQGDLLVAISTSGASPALARKLRRQLQVTLGREYRGYLRFMRGARKQVMKSVPTPEGRARVFRQLSGAAVVDWLRAGAPRRAWRDAKRVLGKLGVKARARE
jgi:precorrin-2 dehydrogenase/sirohydrochlorin ferrochelatase